MATYSELRPFAHYLLRDVPEGEIKLVSTLMQTDKCVLLRSYNLGENTDFWKKKTEVVIELIQELSAADFNNYIRIYEDDDFEEDFDDGAEEEESEDDGVEEKY